MVATNPCPAGGGGSLLSRELQHRASQHLLLTGQAARPGSGGPQGAGAGLLAQAGPWRMPGCVEDRAALEVAVARYRNIATQPP